MQLNTLTTNNTDEIQLIDSDQPQRILAELKQRESLLQTTRETVISQQTTLITTIPDNNELVKNRPLEDCAEVLEYVIHKVQRVTIIYAHNKKEKNLRELCHSLA